MKDICTIGYRIVGYIWYASKQLIWFLIFFGGKIGEGGFKNYSKTMNITLNKQKILNSLLDLRQWRSQLFSSWRNLYKSVSSKDFVWVFLFLKLGGVGYVCCGGYRFINTPSSILLACHCWFDTLLWSPERFLYFVSSADWFSSLSL